MFSVKWYEPLGPGPEPETIFVAAVGRLKLPTGRGWHEQSTSKYDTAHQLADALRHKGYALVKVIEEE